MDVFSKLFGNFIAFVYHCFDRIVIYGYLSALSRPEQVVHFFRQVVGVPVVSKEVLSQRTADYQNWVANGSTTGPSSWGRSSPPTNASSSSSHAFTQSPRSSIAATSFSSATFPSTTCSSAAASSACGGSPPTRLPRSSAGAFTAGCAANSPLS